MGTEIERKFLVVGDAWRTAHGILFRQGYLSTHQARTVRVRIEGTCAKLTIKGASRGPTRSEFEYEVPLADAHELLALCEQPCVEKTRHRVPFGAHTFEIDEFHGVNAGLVIAELELSAENEAYEKPPWLGAEVTHDPRYFNSNLVANPFTTWVGG
jgi:adenylate cyclase